MAELLLEILSEEIPARMQARAAEDLLRLVTKGLVDAGLVHGKAAAFVTPRRLALVVADLPERQPDVREERRGPRTDAPQKAIDGFLGSVGMSREQASEQQTPKGTFLIAIVEKKGGPVRDILVAIVEAALTALPWPKSMRWAGHRVRWVRPIQSILCLLDGAVVPVNFGPIAAGDTTRGHRFMAPQAFSVSGFSDYKQRLGAAKVMLDPAERRALIKGRAAELAAALGLTVKDDAGLLDEVAGLVEWPVVRIGRIGQDFMSLPPEVLTGTMRTNQKYLSLLRSDGGLAARFAVVANMETVDDGAAVIAGNERVLRARLSDAKFFWDQDRKHLLASRVGKLAERVFHAKLGTDGDRVGRLAELVRSVAPHVPGAAPEAAARAALLCKADLTTGMVGEFPELQGIMGRYYALNDGEAPGIAEAIAQHYAPKGPDDACPTAPLSVAVALADKIDTLVGFFGIDEKPTGSKDPFALRRAALGIIRLIVENKLRLPLGAPIREAYRLYAKSGVSFHAMGRDEPLVERELLDFLADRLKVHLREQGVRHDLVAAVFALGGEDDLVRMLARVEALQGFLATENGANLLTAYKRASNIVRIEEKKDGAAHDGAVAEDRLGQDEERALFGGLARATPAIAAAVQGERFAEAMQVLAGLRAPVDAFFDKVTVNADDAGLRGNRLRLLSRIRSALDGVADFSRIEG